MIPSHLSRAQRPRPAFAVAVMLLAISTAASQETAPKTDSNQVARSDKKRLAQAVEEAKAAAESFDFYLGTERKTKLKLVREPILRFTNPVLADVYGNVFVWTHNGRPQVVASLNKWYSPERRLAAELQSLSSSRVVAERKGQRVWAPEQAGIELKPVPGAPRPAKERPQRLRQMRLLARQFAARAAAKGRRLESGGDVDVKLRMLSQPLYRYDSKDEGVVDGGLFVFVRGTDPELFLILELLGSGQEATWQYAPARMNSFQFKLTYQGREVWEVPQLAPPWTNVQEPKRPYFLLPYLVRFAEDE